MTGRPRRSGPAPRPGPGGTCRRVPCCCAGGGMTKSGSGASVAWAEAADRGGAFVEAGRILAFGEQVDLDGVARPEGRHAQKLEKTAQRYGDLAIERVRFGQQAVEIGVKHGLTRHRQVHLPRLQVVRIRREDRPAERAHARIVVLPRPAQGASAVPSGRVISKATPPARRRCTASDQGRGSFCGTGSWGTPFVRYRTI
jgi:hypothetical protein